MTAKQRLAAIVEHVERVHSAMDADRETGSHHRNNAAAETWCKDNRYLLKWFTELFDLTRAVPELQVYGSGNAVRAIHQAVGESTWEELHRIFQAAVDPEAELVVDQHGNQHIESEIAPREDE